MNKLILYHGSKNIVQKPTFGFGDEKNDYGLGFYCTQSLGCKVEDLIEVNRQTNLIEKAGDDSKSLKQ